MKAPRQMLTAHGALRTRTDSRRSDDDASRFQRKILFWSVRHVKNVSFVPPLLRFVIMPTADFAAAKITEDLRIPQ